MRTIYEPGFFPTAEQAKAACSKSGDSVGQFTGLVDGIVASLSVGQEDK